MKALRAAALLLTVSGAAGSVASLHFVGSYSSGAFGVAPDGNGGTIVRPA